jgi:tetratricopeptide (TPR) repeat protein
VSPKLIQFEQMIQDCDLDIRSGRAQNISRRLSKINSAKVPHEFRLPLAKICRRAGLYTLGMKLLTVRETDLEEAEYAALLIRIGAVSEAMANLQKIDVTAAPEALLFRAYGYFGKWQYHQAIEELQEYLKFPLLPYANLVGQMNLALAFVEVRNHGAAQQLLDENIFWSARDGHRQVQSNCHALRAQVYIQECNFSEARQELARAESLISASGNNDHRFFRKLELILTGLESRKVEPFRELSTHSIKTRDWESRREADLYKLKIDFQRSELDHLYFGTPFEPFRDLINSELGVRSDRLEYHLGPLFSPCLDLRTAEVDGRALFKPGQKSHLLIEIMLRDFYQPLRIAGLFSALFPNEHFSVATSPERVRQILWRTRQVFQSQKIPVAIIEAGGFYSLEIKGPFSFNIPLDRPTISSLGISLDKLTEQFAGTPHFLAKEAQLKLNLPKSNIRQIIQFGLNEGKIERVGSSNVSTRYRVVSTRDAKRLAA